MSERCRYNPKSTWVKAVYGSQTYYWRNGQASLEAPEEGVRDEQEEDQVSIPPALLILHLSVSRGTYCAITLTRMMRQVTFEKGFDPLERNRKTELGLLSPASSWLKYSSGVRMFYKHQGSAELKLTRPAEVTAISRYDKLSHDAQATVHGLTSALTYIATGYT
jgi:hypothetical protein